MRCWKNFNSRPSARGDQGIQPVRCGYDISIHAPPRGATCRRLRRSACFHFNSRPSARGDRNGGAVISRRRNFNSRPSARGDSKTIPCQANNHISIHAPPRGATHPRILERFPRPISIHAPPRGATRKEERKALNQKNFNSRPSARGDY